jgi:hypothetical protein
LPTGRDQPSACGVTGSIAATPRCCDLLNESLTQFQVIISTEFETGPVVCSFSQSAVQHLGDGVVLSAVGAQQNPVLFRRRSVQHHCSATGSPSAVWRRGFRWCRCSIPCATSSTASRIGPAVTRLQYDEVGNVTRWSFVDVTRQPVVAQMLGASGMGITHDRRGNITSETFFGPDQKFVIGVLRAFEGLLTWGTNGYPSETTYRDDKGHPTRVEVGCATIRTRYDAGNLSELSCLNEQGAPTISTPGYYSTRSTYDAFGRIDKETYLDAQGRPVRIREGFAAATYTYGTGGNQVTTEYWDEHGSRATTAEGYSAIHRTFNQRRLEVATTYLDSKDRPAQRYDGYSTVRYEYDQRGFVNRLRICEGGEALSRPGWIRLGPHQAQFVGSATRIHFLGRKEHGDNRLAIRLR